MNKFKVGLIGCGKQAEKHIASLKKIPIVEVVLADIQCEIAKNLAEKSHVSWTENPDLIFEDKGIEAVLICTPTPSHAKLIKATVSAEKDVFCEKPLCASLEEACELHKIESESDRIVMVGYIYRHIPIFEEAYKIIVGRQIHGESLVLGRTLHAFFRLGGRGGHQVWKHMKDTGGGAVNEMLVHIIDLANWYFGPLHDIELISYSLHCPERDIQGQTVKVDAEDYVMIRCFGANGVEIICQADLITPAFCQFVEIQGENGTFMGSIQQDMPSYLFLKESRGGYNAGKTEFSFGLRNFLDIQMAAFIQAVVERKKLDRNTIEDSIVLMQILDEIQRYMEEVPKVS